MIRKDMLWAWGLAVAAIIAGLALFYVVPRAHAGSWSGCYIGVAGELSSATGEGLGADGKGVAPKLGCDVQNGKFVVGAWADYAWSQYDWAGNTIDVKGWAAGGRAGYVVIPNVLAYGLVGYTEFEADAFGGSADLSGMVYGGGAEVALGRKWYSSLEYRYEPLSVVGLDADLKNQSVRLGFSYKFGFGNSVEEPLKLPSLK